MPDEINPTSTTPNPQTTPVLPDPQDMVDAALSADTTTPPTTKIEEPPTTEPLPTLSPLDSTPAKPAEPVTPPTPPVTTPVGEPAMPNTNPVIPIGDDTPLAFAGKPIESMDKQAETTKPLETTMSVDPEPILNAPSSMGAPLPPVVPPVPESKKKKGSIGKVVMGLAIMVLAIGGGIYGYSQFMGKQLQTAKQKIASASPEASAVTPQIARITEDTGKAIVKQTPAQVKTGGGQVSSKTEGKQNTVVNVKVGALDAAQEIATLIDNTDMSKPGAQKELQDKADEIALIKAQEFDNESKIGEPCDSELSTLKCNGGMGICSKGICTANYQSCDPTDKGGTGCPETCANFDVTGWSKVTEPGGGSYCNAQGEKCSKYRNEMLNPDKNKWCFVNYGEQCGGSCGGNPPPSAPPSTPTMKCDGLSSVPDVTPAPVVGAKLTFTCAGSVSPSTAGTVSYKFRYSINSGTPVALTPLTATPNKAELTINACGTYKVECQACATLNGVLTCSPVWTGATQ